MDPSPDYHGSDKEDFSKGFFPLFSSGEVSKGQYSKQIKTAKKRVAKRTSQHMKKLRMVAVLKAKRCKNKNRANGSK